MDWNVSDMSLPSLSSVPCPGSMSESLSTVWLIFTGCYRLSLNFKEPLYGKRGWTKAHDHGISCPTTHCITQKMKPWKGFIKDNCLTQVPVTSCEDRALVQRWNTYLKQWSLKILIPIGRIHRPRIQVIDRQVALSSLSSVKHLLNLCFRFLRL